MESAKIKEKLKNRGFWAGILTALAGLVGGSLSAPDFMIKLIQLIGG
ncbi:MAG: hypothetical protein J6N45_09785 [Alphaproteobacteria bacterium]|nr:hypothetical protein [Alphaproteobacteria bacterium]